MSRAEARLERVREARQTTDTTKNRSFPCFICWFTVPIGRLECRADVAAFLVKKNGGFLLIASGPVKHEWFF
ncbi:MAG TPA: hypothetical protein VNN17_11515 [Terriglobia bacterium]|nr:hypothetical protein [Terriglobia bacterium]